MFYEFTITVPHATGDATPVRQRLPLTAGTIHRVDVQFPIGTRCLVHARLLHQEHQLYPTNPDGDLAADGQTLAIDGESFELIEPYELVFSAYSTADTYDYEIRVRVSVYRPEEVEQKVGWIGGLRNLLKLVGLGG